MVRRWSYLNLINNTFSAEHKGLAFAHHFATFKATTYYRKSIYRITKLSRRAWSRRKHLHNWLVYQNLLANWSQDYLFFRKYSRFVISLHLFKNSYLTYNLLIFKRSTSTNFLGSESVVVSSIIKRVIRYSSRLNPVTYSFFRSYKNVPWLYVTTPANLEEVQKASDLTLDTIYLNYQSAYYISEASPNDSVWLQLLIKCLFLNSLNQAVELYKVLLLLTLVSTY
jgi:hypothetical protein